MHRPLCHEACRAGSQTRGTGFDYSVCPVVVISWFEALCCVSHLAWQRYAGTPKIEGHTSDGVTCVTNMTPDGQSTCRCVAAPNRRWQMGTRPRETTPSNAQNRHRSHGDDQSDEVSLYCRSMMPLSLIYCTRCTLHELIYSPRWATLTAPQRRCAPVVVPFSWSPLAGAVDTMHHAAMLGLSSSNKAVLAYACVAWCVFGMPLDVQTQNPRSLGCHRECQRLCCAEQLTLTLNIEHYVIEADHLLNGV